MSLRYPHSSGEIQRGWNNGIYNEVFVFPSIREVATPRGLAHMARLGLPMTSWFKGVPVERLAQEQVFASVFVFAL